MRHSTPDEHSTTIPRIRGHFHRPRIDYLLSGLLDHHLIVVTAGAGWGKTHAVSMFLQHTKAHSMWLQLSALDNYPTRFWEEFVSITAYQNRETADKLTQLGFPETLVQFNQFLHILVKNIYVWEQVVFVLDDFHLIYEESIIHFVENLVAARLENFCVIINSRTKPRLKLAGELAGDLVGYVTAEDLYFVQDETESYLKQHDISLTAQGLERVQGLTKGWPLALSLVCLSIKKGGMDSNDPVADAIPLIFEMIERELFSDYSPQLRRFLVKLSLLSSFPEELIKILAGDDFEAVLEIINTNMFVYYNPYSRQYSFHHLFLEFLRAKQKHLTPQEIGDTNWQAAEWCGANDLKIDAFAYYDKCGRYDKILNIMLSFGTATFSRAVADFYISLIRKFPPELIRRNPIVHVLHAGLLLNNAELESAQKKLLEVRGELEALPLTEDNKTVLGEIYCMLGLISLGSCNYNFTELFKKASEYLPNGGRIDNTGKPINTKYAIMLSSSAPGELKKMEEALFGAMPYMSIAMNGYGQGLDYLASAEAAYFTGDMKKAARNAYEAIYRAREKQVSDVASSGYFLMMRIEASNGNYKGVVSHLEQLKAYAESLNDKWNFNGMLDVAEGWFNVMLGRMENVASWVLDDALGGKVLAPYSIGMERAVKAKWLLKSGKYYELLAWLNQCEELFLRANMQFVLLNILTYKSVALHHIHHEEQAVDGLCNAYGIAHENGLVMQFIELGHDMRAVIYTAKRNELSRVPDTWLDGIYTKAATYEKHLNNIKSQYHQIHEPVSTPQVKLTKREKEMLRYLCQGLTNMEIADTRDISISAVKKSLNNIYIKLGATNRADAVRMAVQMELHR